MSILAQIGVIFGVFLAAEGISAVLPFAFSEAVIGMILFLILLFSRILRPSRLKQTSDFLLGNMALFLVPVTVSVMKYIAVLLENLWVILLISIVTTPLVYFVTGQVVQLTMKIMKKGGEMP